jgi:hypothetical protein
MVWIYLSALLERRQLGLCLPGASQIRRAWRQDALDILNERYARGEITHEQLAFMKSKISRAADPARVWFEWQRRISPDGRHFEVMVGYSAAGENEFTVITLSSTDLTAVSFACVELMALSLFDLCRTRKQYR